MTGFQDFLNDLAELEKQPESVGLDLRLDLAEIILRHLDGKNWTQTRLAAAAGMKSPFLTRITHAAQNCTFESAGRILHALGIKAKLVEVPANEIIFTVTSPGKITNQEVSNGKQEIKVFSTGGAGFHTYTASSGPGVPSARFA